MLLQPAILALLLSAGIGLGALLLASPAAFELVRHWDLQSGSERQLRLERRTYLLSALVRFVLFTQLAALLLFVINADQMAVQFVGAMCAVGTLQANGYGFPALLAQIALFFGAALWLLLNHADNQARDYPLVRIKFTLLLLVVLPLLALSTLLQVAYFSHLRADVITSCCGSLFSAETESVTGDLAGLPPRPAMSAWLLVTVLAIVANAGVWLGRPRSWGTALAGLSSLLGFVVALAAIISFISLYVYEHPHHHCPFCLLQAEHHYTGYLLYPPLFIATAAGMAVGLINLFRHKTGLQAVLPQFLRQLAATASLGFSAFLGVSIALILNSNLILLKP